MRGSTYDPLKRALDVVGATAIFVVTLPLQAIVAALIRMRLGAPILFRQDRPGRNGEIFTLVKFRTMKSIDSSVLPQDDADRLTPLGRRLRATSMDELPTLINVMKGEMSLVGPRPLLVTYLERYAPHQARRHEVRPGITGLAQVSGRNSISWGDKFQHDVEYVDRRSLRLDLTILLRTVLPVLRHQGISHEGVATMQEFTGEATYDEHDT